MAQIPPGTLAYEEEHINESRHLVIIVPSAIAIALAYVAVPLRYHARRLQRMSLGCDDWMVAIGLVGIVYYC